MRLGSPSILYRIPFEFETHQIFAQSISIVGNLAVCTTDGEQFTARVYPKDEAPAAYKDFNQVLDSVRLAGLASEVARLKARFVIKDSDDSLKGAA